MAIHESFLHKILERGVLGTQAIHESFLRENRIFHQYAKVFFFSKASRYMVFVHFEHVTNYLLYLPLRQYLRHRQPLWHKAKITQPAVYVAENVINCEKFACYIHMNWHRQHCHCHHAHPNNKCLLSSYHLLTATKTWLKLQYSHVLAYVYSCILCASTKILIKKKPSQKSS